MPESRSGLYQDREESKESDLRVDSPQAQLDNAD
jgi:hypothetical protein